MFDIDHTAEQKQSLADGFNIASVSLAVLGMFLSLAAGVTIMSGYNDFVRWMIGLSVAGLGNLFSYSLFLGIAGYWNYDS